MKNIILFLATFSICFVLIGIVEAQQDQTSGTKSVIAVVTLLDGAQQEWEKVEFVYLSGKTLPYFKYGVGADQDGHRRGTNLIIPDPDGVFLVIDRIDPQEGRSIKAEYSNEPKFKHLVLTAKPEIEGRVIGTDCRKTVGCVETGIRVKGLCRVAGQAKDCSAYLVPSNWHPVVDKTDFIREISFVAR